MITILHLVTFGKHLRKKGHLRWLIVEQKTQTGKRRFTGAGRAGVAACRLAIPGGIGHCPNTGFVWIWCRYAHEYSRNTGGKLALPFDLLQAACLCRLRLDMHGYAGCMQGIMLLNITLKFFAGK